MYIYVYTKAQFSDLYRFLFVQFYTNGREKESVGINGPAAVANIFHIHLCK